MAKENTTTPKIIQTPSNKAKATVIPAKTETPKTTITKASQIEELKYLEDSSKGMSESRRY